jgi:hypothetical protein
MKEREAALKELAGIRRETVGILVRRIVCQGYDQFPALCLAQYPDPGNRWAAMSSDSRQLLA